jgi:hypothetical protein
VIGDGWWVVGTATATTNDTATATTNDTATAERQRQLQTTRQRRNGNGNGNGNYKRYGKFEAFGQELKWLNKVAVVR